MNSRVLKPWFVVLAMVLTIAACNGDPEPDDPAPAPQPEPERVDATIEEYAVEGEDCDEVRTALFPEDGSHPGKINCEPLIPRFGFSARTDTDGNCVLTLGNVDTSYTIRIRVPKWDAPQGADTRCFDKFIEDLRRHEDAHADVCREHMPMKLEAAKAAIDGLDVPLEGECEVEEGQINLSEAQEKQLDEAVDAALAAAQPYKDACEALDGAQDAIDEDASLDAVLDCDCP
jgi:predicted secreted Zn-dependent protease